MEAHLESADLKKIAADGNDALISWYNRSENNRLSVVQQQHKKINLKGLLFLDTNFSGSSFENCDLSNSTFINCNFDNSKFTKCNFNKTKFENSINASSLSIKKSTFIKADLSNQDFSNALFTNNNLCNCILENTKLNKCDLKGCNFHETVIGKTEFDGCKNLSSTSNLEKTIVKSSPEKYEVNKYNVIDNIFNWEIVRIFGKLPLFGASYLAIVLIPILFGIIKYLNNHIQIINNFIKSNYIFKISKAQIFADQYIIHKITLISYPDFPELILISSILLAIGSTIYNLFCPSRIKEFSHDVWVDQLYREPIHYFPVAVKNRPMILISLISYTFGAILSLFVIINNLLKTINYINNL
ncbi:MAG: pentapeptide repeat-containing protein [Desulfobulbus sp.]|nr:pentapeptide repeat-containing protein [Desulfobulbus sp.]